MKTIILIIVLLLASYGMADLLSRAAYRLLFFERKTVCVLPLFKTEDAEFLIRQAAQEQNRSCRYEWVAVDCGLAEERESIEQLCRKLGITFCEKEDFFELFSVGLQDKRGVV